MPATESEDLRELDARVAEEIKKARKAAGLTQKEAGDLVGLSRTSVVNIEAGRQSLSVKNLMRFASALNVSAAQLLNESDRREQAEEEIPNTVAYLASRYSEKWQGQDDNYWMRRLNQEVSELQLVLDGQHDDPATLELAEIASICINWIRKRRAKAEKETTRIESFPCRYNHAAD